ncbi:hypothetical protein Tco_0329061 [Tanacetum coccineum]
MNQEVVNILIESKEDIWNNDEFDKDGDYLVTALAVAAAVPLGSMGKWVTAYGMVVGECVEGSGVHWWRRVEKVVVERRSQNRRDLPRDNPLVSVEVFRYDIKRSKSENKGIVPTEMELVLEQTQQCTSHEVSVSTEGVEE